MMARLLGRSCTTVRRVRLNCVEERVHNGRTECEELSTEPKIGARCCPHRRSCDERGKSGIDAVVLLPSIISRTAEPMRDFQFESVCCCEAMVIATSGRA